MNESINSLFGVILAASNAPPASTGASSALPLGWFDFVVIIVLLVGVILGRKRGMSGEVLNVLQWLAIAIGGAFVYRPVGKFLAQSGDLSLFTAYLAVYVLFALVISVTFSLIARSVGQKLVGSEVFGNFEYYLGMTAGAIQYLCIVIFVMALLNARLYTDAELAAKAKEMEKNFGSVTLPTLSGIQQDVFKDSLAGKYTKQYLPMMLIESTAPGGKPKETIGQKRQREMDSIIGK